jgi:integrase
VKSAIVPYFRELGTLLCDLTADDINEFYDVQLDRIKGVTVQKYHGNISMAIKYALKKNLIQHTVMDRVERPQAERYAATFLKQSEVVALFDAVKGHKLELGVMLGAFYGLRRGEIVGLRWSAIDFEANTISIEHTVTMINLDGKSMIFADDTVKTKSSFRTLPLIPAFRAKLLEIRETQQGFKKLCGRSWNKLGNDYVYTDQLGNRVHPNYLSREFPVFLVKHGFRKMRFHDTRHSCASLLLANGVPLKQIQEWLGHSKFSFTADSYAHLEYDSKLSAAQSMSWINQTSYGRLLSSEPATT